MMKKRIQILSIFLFGIIYLEFFDAQFLDDRIVRYLNFVTLMGVTALSIPFLNPAGKEGFIVPVKLILFSVLISIPMAYVSWGQSIKSSLIVSHPHFLWAFFFYLLYIKPSIKTIEKIALIYGLLYVLCYFYQLANTPTVIFGRSLWGEEFIVQRGTVRILFPGGGTFFLALFIAINKLTIQSKRKWLLLSVTILGVVIPFLQATRQFIAGVLMIYLYHFLKNKNYFQKAFVALAFAGLIVLAFNSNNSIVEGLIEASRRDMVLGDEYVRVPAGIYFLTDFSPNFLSRIFGNGAPYWGYSAYGSFIEKLAYQKGYFLSDVGIIAMYAMFGIFAVLGYVLIWIKSFTIPVPKEYYYLKYYLWYLLLTCLTSASVYHYHYLMTNIFVLYIYQMIIQRTVEVSDLESGNSMKLFIEDLRS